MRRACIAMKSGCWGGIFRKDTGRKESSVNGPLKEFGKLMRRWQWMISAAWALHMKSWEKHWLLAAHHRASRRNGRSHFVVRLPALKLFPVGRLNLVGIDGTQRRQQEKEEALQLVVRGLWRPIRMESAKQDAGGTDRCQRQWSEGDQSTRNPVEIVWEPDQCVQTAGEPAEIWWQSDSKHCSRPARKK